METEAKPIGEVAASALTSMQERQTTAKDTNIKTPQLSLFQTFNDPVLETMRAEAQAFLTELSSGLGEPRWLSFVGESGTGKTFLCNLIREAAPAHFKNHPSFKRAGYCVKWSNLISGLRDGDFSIHEEPWPLLMIDDVGASTDTEFAAAQLSRLLNERMGKWTLITSNLTLEGISNRIDMRITSRLVRGNNVCVEVETIDFALRKLRKK